MTTLKWSDVYYRPLTLSESSEKAARISVGDTAIDFDNSIHFEGRNDAVSVEALLKAGFWLRKVAPDSCRPQLAYHLFAATHRSSYLDPYFPLVKHLDKDARKQFHKTISQLLLHPGFDIQLLKIAPAAAHILERESSTELNFNFNYLQDYVLANCIRVIPAVAYLVAGHMAEVFFYRQDILERLLNSTIHIWLYTDPDSFKTDGGVAGGCYNPERKCLQLVVSRLFEGFNQPNAGVCPFLHEFGHLLDFFDAGTGKADQASSGWLPGMRPSDGDIFTPDARNAFIAGKRLEMQRYERQVANPDGTDPLPIGHPYVFQSNSEFIAGYLEMFFRNPHSFAAQNPDLFNGFASLLKQDPRQYWEADFPFYMQQNRDFYRSGQKPRMHGLTLKID